MWKEADVLRTRANRSRVVLATLKQTRQSQSHASSSNPVAYRFALLQSIGIYQPWPSSNMWRSCIRFTRQRRFIPSVIGTTPKFNCSWKDVKLLSYFSIIARIPRLWFSIKPNLTRALNQGLRGTVQRVLHDQRVPDPDRFYLNLCPDRLRNASMRFFSLLTNGVKIRSELKLCWTIKHVSWIQTNNLKRTIL